MVISNIRQSLLQDNNSTSKIPCSLYLPLTNGNMTIYDIDNNTEFLPTHYKYLLSDSEGTQFNKTIGHGIYFWDNSHAIKSFSLEVKISPIETGSVSTTWGEIAALGRYNMHIVSLINQPRNNRWVYTGTISNGGTNDQYVTTAYTKDLWHKICIVSTYDYNKVGMTWSYTIGMYIDGQYVGQYTNYDERWINYSGNGPDYFIIGNSWRLERNGVNSSNINPLCGTVRNVRIFRRTLTAEEALVETI